jgi:putative transposase
MNPLFDFMSKYKSKNHSKFIIKYHIIFVVKYRKRLLIRLGKEIKNILQQISNNYDFEIIIMEVDKDHIHLLIETEPKISPLMIVRVLKQQSTIKLWNKYPKYLSKYFWKEKTFWTDGYFVSTIGKVFTETIIKYIENQG